MSTSMSISTSILLFKVFVFELPLRPRRHLPKGGQYPPHRGGGRRPGEDHYILTFFALLLLIPRQRNRYRLLFFPIE